ncbi:hypothetical protein HETIRDRAFT_455104 [Heterobasidion irregulare TC 32-1]|uniref:Uncharacterized protein n=1 Tax=Heterobasidion irregulare (strain TC 32-1) TaxID=747525 RepID=W4JSY9_HETIT|nr:uncharacterized protein HETIRDRAFT_455104 [Heterobasidion irregulare TC 32-1]ETW76574.1 hypothetical protein HETIRDRAFT_455104 [Heterobasidion irregulare TC 32-1]
MLITAVCYDGKACALLEGIADSGGIEDVSTSVTNFTVDTSTRGKPKAVAYVNYKAVMPFEADDKAQPMLWDN